jgi:membrane-bound lytic murein transglycosylase D
MGGHLLRGENAVTFRCRGAAALLLLILNLHPVAARPFRSKQEEIPDLRHHAWPERFQLPMPDGDPQFERFKAAYRTPGGMKWLEAVYARSRPYASYIYRRIRELGLPEELFFLPFIESEYLPKAVSRSGAMGLWQFMRNSIGGYNIRMDDWLDERRDFMKSTDAALHKLQWNYQRFGDWLLAIAAYNCGAGAMDRAIAAGGVRDFWKLREKGLLPSETAAYIPKFLAVIAVSMHAGRNGLATPWAEATEWVRVPVTRPVDLSMLSEVTGIPLATLTTGNPELRHAVTPPEGRYELKVPEAFRNAVVDALASTDRLMNVYIHQARSGDTVSAIARHYDVSVQMIARMNPGMNPDRIRIGQRIVVPAFKDTSPYEGVRMQDDQLVFGGKHRVAQGDTLWSLSLVYGVQPEVLAEKNGLTLFGVLREGAELIVPILN